MAAPLVSVVTPFYNTAEWLGACIESVLAQSLGDFEYVLVNNCSTDGSAEIARKYANLDRRIRVVEQPEFLSQSRNFNAALRSISPDSRYCKMILADDLMFASCLQEMVGVAQRHPSIGIVSSYFLKGPHLAAVGLPYPEECFSGREIGRIQMLKGRYFLGSPSVVMYRSDIVRRNPVFFQDHKYSSDTIRAYQCLLESDMGFVYQVLTFLRDRDDSIGASVEDFRHYLLDAYIQLQTHGKQLLSPDEYMTVRKRLERKYFGFLGIESLYNRRPALWNFTRDGLALVGESFSGWRRVRWMLSGAFFVITHPGKLVRAVARKIAGRTTSPAASDPIRLGQAF